MNGHTTYTESLCQPSSVPIMPLMSMKVLNHDVENVLARGLNSIKVRPKSRQWHPRSLRYEKWGYSQMLLEWCLIIWKSSELLTLSMTFCGPYITFRATKSTHLLYWNVTHTNGLWVIVNDLPAHRCTKTVITVMGMTTSETVTHQSRMWLSYNNKPVTMNI